MNTHLYPPGSAPCQRPRPRQSRLLCDRLWRWNCSWWIVPLLMFGLPFEARQQDSSLDHFSWSGVPAQTQTGQSFGVSLTARDGGEGVVTQFAGIASISGLAPGASPAVLITEVETLSTERVEIANLSSEPVDVSGWHVVFYDSQTWPSPTITFIVPSGTTCAPHGVFQVRSGGVGPGTYPTFNLGVPLYWGASTDYPYVAVALLDAAGRKVDFCCAMSGFPGLITLPGPLSESDWSGRPVVANDNPSLTYQRTGAYDHNNAGDWVATNNSFGLFNSGLQLPFLAAPIKVAVTPDSATFTNGVWSGSLAIVTPATNLVLRADDLAGHAGDSSPITVAGLPPLRILVPPQAFEATPGFLGFGSVSVPGPLTSNLLVSLASSDTSRIVTTPATIIYAGATDGYFALTNLSDGLPNGPQVVTVTATAAGFAPASGLITNFDVGSVGFSLVLPSSAREGAGWVSNAQVQVSLPVSADVLVRLASSNTNELRMPATVVIPAGSNAVSFAFQVLDDGRIAGTERVTVTASVLFWQNASAEIDVADAATTNLALILPALAIEGSGLFVNVGAASIAGTLATNLVVTLSSTDPIRLLLPATVVIPAGQTSALFFVTFPDDSQMQGTEVVTATGSAPGFAPSQANVSIADNDVHHLGFAAISPPQYLGQPFSVRLYTAAIDGQAVAGFSGSANISAHNGSLTPPSLAVTFTNGLWVGPVTVTSGTTNVTLAATAAGGLAAESNPFRLIRPVVRQLALPTQDLVADPLRGRLYATVPASAGGAFASSLARIDPLTGTIESDQYVGLDPNKLAVSDGGEYVYVGVDGESAVRQFNLTSQSLGPAFSLGAGLFALDLEVMPGNPNTLAVSRSQFEPFGPAGIAIYDHGNKLTNEAGDPNVITFGSSNVLYGYWNYTTAWGFFRMLVDGNGVTVESSSGPLLYAYQDIQYDAGRVYTTLGGVLDPDQFKVLGQLPVSGVVKSDSALNRVYVVFQDSTGWFLGAYDRTTLALCGKVPLPGLSGSPSSLVQWGTNGLAFRTSGSQVFLIETELVPQTPSADLAVQQAPIMDTVLAGSNVTYSVVLTNKGPLAATDFMVQDQLPAGTVLVSATSTKGTCELRQNVLVCPVGTLAVGETASVTLVLRTSLPGYLTNSASVSADQADARPADNASACVAAVVSAPGPIAASVQILSASDLAWHPGSQRLYATVRGDDPRFGNRLVRLNPASGNVEAAWFVGSEPRRVVPSSDHRYLYVVVDGGARVRRFDLTTETSDLAIDVELGLVADDLAPLTGLPQSIAFTRLIPNSTGTAAMVVYDNGVLRFTSGISYLIQPGEDASTLYSFDTGFSTSLTRFRLGTNDASPEASTVLQESPYEHFQYGAGLVFTPLGDVVYGPTATRVGGLTNLGSANSRLMASDAAAGRVFYLGQTGGSAVLSAHSRSRLQFLGSGTLTGLNGTASSLTRWGTNGLAFCTAGRQLFLLRTDLVAPTNSPSDLLVTQTVPSQMTFAAPFVCTVTVSNQGPGTASDVVLTDMLPAGGAVISASSSQGAFQVSSNLVTCSLGSLPAGTAASLLLTLIAHDPGTLKNAAIAGSSGPELNPLDDFSTVNLPASFISVLSLPINDLVYDPIRARIFAAVGPSGGTLSNSIVEIDPATGALGPALPLPDYPLKLALSDDSQFLYVGLANTGGVVRVNLALRTKDLYFSLGVADNGFRYVVGDMEVLPGQPHALAVSINDWYNNVAVAVHDDGVPRSNMVPHREFGGPYPIAFSTNSSVLHQTTLYSFRTLRIDGSGATLVAEVGPLGPGYDTAFESDHGFVFFTTGYEADPVLNRVVTNFPASGLVAPDLANGRVYYVTATGQAPFNWQLTLRAFDAATTRELWSVPFAPVQGAARHLVKLGNNGVALTTDAGLLFIVRAGQLSPPGADLQLTQSFTPGGIASGANATCTMSLRNLGPWTATGVTLSNPVPANLLIAKLTASKGVVVQTYPAVVVQVGMLANGETATVSLTCTATNQGWYTNQSFASLVEPDPNPANNSSASTLQIGPPVFLTISDASAREGVGGASHITFNALLSATSNLPVYVRYQTLDGTAVAGVDYNTNYGLFTMPAGTVSRALTLISTIRGNTLVQSNRFFYLNLLSATNATLSRTQAVATIVDDDFRTITATNITLLEGNSGITNALFNIGLAPPSTGPVTVDYQTIAGMANPGSDYGARAGTLRFEPGVTNVTLSVPVHGDTLPEMDETLFLLLSQPSGAVLGPDALCATIVNDDAVPPLALSGFYWAGEDLHLQFASISGRLYRVERTLLLTTQSWSSVADSIPGSGGLVEVTDPAAAQRLQGFYRLVLLP